MIAANIRITYMQEIVANDDCPSTLKYDPSTHYSLSIEMNLTCPAHHVL